MNSFVAEGLGTFALVLMGCGAIIVNDLYGGVLGHLGVSLVFGLIVMVMIYSVGNISGAHLNPAVSLGFFFAGKLKISVTLAYILSQLTGAVLASVLLYLLFPTHPTLGATIPVIDFLPAFCVEVVLSFILMFVILSVSTGHMEKGIMAGVAIGGTVALAALTAGPLTGASMNPARSFGPAITSGQMDNIVIYVTAPFLGTFLAHLTCRLVQGKECCVREETQ